MPLLFSFWFDCSVSCSREGWVFWDDESQNIRASKQISSVFNRVAPKGKYAVGKFSYDLIMNGLSGR